MAIKTPKSGKIKRALQKREPKLVENGKKTLILNGTKTSNVISSLLKDLHHLKRGTAVRFSKKNEGIHPFENGGEVSLEFFSLKTDCSIFVFGSHSKKRPHNIVLGRTYNYHIYDLVEVGVENFKQIGSFEHNKKIAPCNNSKPLITFVGDGFETVEELKHLKEFLLEIFREEVVDNLNLVGVDRAYVCTAISSDRVFFTHCALVLKKSGSLIPRIELVEVGPSMDFVIRRHRLPSELLRKEAIKTASGKNHKKVKNVSNDLVKGKTGKIYIPDQQVGTMVLSHKLKGMKRKRQESKKEPTEESEPGSQMS